MPDPYTFTMGLQTDPAQTFNVVGSDAMISNLTSISTSWMLTWIVGNAGTNETTSGATATVTSLVQRPASVPEPGAAVLLLTGMPGLAARRKRAAR